MMASGSTKALFLPGASGVARFWQPVMKRLALPIESVSFDYPGFGGNPPDPKLASLDDLTDWIDRQIEGPVDVLAQSMGGVIGLQVALRHPDLVRHLVLTGTSGGVPMGRFNATEWRDDYLRESPDNPRWFTDTRIDLSKRVANLPVPTLLIFGTRDPIAPLAAGEHLARLLPNARLVTVETDSHFFVRDLPDVVTPLIRDFLTS